MAAQPLLNTRVRYCIEIPDGATEPIVTTRNDWRPLKYLCNLTLGLTAVVGVTGLVTNVFDIGDPGVINMASGVAFAAIGGGVYTLWSMLSCCHTRRSIAKAGDTHVQVPTIIDKKPSWTSVPVGSKLQRQIEEQLDQAHTLWSPGCGNWEGDRKSVYILSVGALKLGVDSLIGSAIAGDPSPFGKGASIAGASLITLSLLVDKCWHRRGNVFNWDFWKVPIYFYGLSSMPVGLFGSLVVLFVADGNSLAESITSTVAVSGAVMTILAWIFEKYGLQKEESGPCTFLRHSRRPTLLLTNWSERPTRAEQET